MKKTLKGTLQTTINDNDAEMLYGRCLTCSHTLNRYTIEKMHPDCTRELIEIGIHCPHCNPLTEQNAA